MVRYEKIELDVVHNVKDALKLQIRTEEALSQ